MISQLQRTDALRNKALTDIRFFFVSSCLFLNHLSVPRNGAVYTEWKNVQRQKVMEKLIKVQKNQSIKQSFSECFFILQNSCIMQQQ